ncbi:hypothetical protein Cha6605_5298 [Chamaesiphon minutus PCC 6605]|uniref:Uncharacterized protein n=1 Tax=Chamaesiphon minutus (strain ATCC 27169 / PCC 6605) TaxID=1173020 RepID=K9UMY9_CHAP6|nr:hypothetical protein Cha6605_5298 [Chamaesiphon minutus PCC 6605]
MTQTLLITKRIIRALSLGSTTVMLALPCVAQTIISPTIINPITSVSTSSPSTNNIDSIKTSQSSKLCYQVDENSKIYIRYKSGGSRSYVANNSQAIMTYPRCD